MARSIQDIEPRTKLVCLPRLAKIRVVMGEPGVRPGELAEHLGRCRQDVSEVLNGAKTSLTIAQEIARFFGRDVQELFFVVDLENPPKLTNAA